MKWKHLTAALALCTSTSLPAATLDVPPSDGTALAAVVARARRGDTVHLPAGTYALADSLWLPSGVRLLGEGAGKTVLTYKGKQPAAIIRLVGVEDVELAAFTLDGGGNANVEAGVFGEDARHLNIHNVTIRHLVKGGDGPHGIHFAGEDPTRRKGVTDSRIADCTFENIGVGAEYGGAIRLSWGSSHNEIVGNTIRGTGRGGIFADNGSTDVTIRKNTVAGSGGEGLSIELWHGCDRGLVEDNRVDHRISLDASDYCAVRRNRIADARDALNYCGLELVDLRYAVFTDNAIEGGQHVGISVSGDKPKEYGYWGYNKVSGCETWAAQLQGEEGGIACQYFYNCSFNGSRGDAGKPLYPNDAGHGLRFNGNARYLTFEGCEFADNHGIGVQLGGEKLEGLRFIDCIIRDNRGAAVSGPAEAMEWLHCSTDRNGTDAPPAVRAGPPAKPNALASEIPATARAGERVAFAVTSGAPAAVLWDLGEGVPSSEANEYHTYDAPGRYRVTLIGWDKAGRAARLEKIVVVTARAP